MHYKTNNINILRVVEVSSGKYRKKISDTIYRTEGKTIYEKIVACNKY